MKHLRSLAVILLVSTTLTAPCFAQEDGERLEKLERDIMMVQRQISRAPSDGSGGSVGTAQDEVRFSNLEEQIRQLRGKLEESEFQNRKLTENFDKLQRDTDFRFNEIAHPPAGAAAAAPAAPATAAAAAAPAKEAPSATSAAAKPDDDGNDQATTSGDGVVHIPANDPDTTALQTEFATPREHYNYAFRLLNQTQYDKAATSFEAFTKKYPKDPLIGNSYYWLGETYYIRRDYVNAADSFRQGFEELPTGPKAPDNLLKLAMSLDALKRDKEACVVLGQVITKFKKTSTAISQKAEQEQKRIDCK